MREILMSSADKSGGGVDPKNLWGKPIPNARMRATAVRKPAPVQYEEKVMDDDVDVDAELDDAAEPAESELQEVEGEYVSVDNLYYDGDSVKESRESSETDETEENLVSQGDDEEPDYDAETGDDDESEDSDDYEDDESEEENVDDDELVSENPDADAVVDVDDDDVRVQTAAQRAQQKTSLLRGNAMPEGKKVTLSDHVRREINKRKESGASVRGCDIVAALEKRGITVSQAQVSQLLKKAGLTSGRPGRPSRQTAPAAEHDAPSRVAERKPHAGGVAAAKPQQRAALTTKATPKTASGNIGFQIPMAQLKAAEAFVTACDGSFQKAERILTVAAQLSQTFAG